MVVPGRRAVSYEREVPVKSRNPKPQGGRGSGGGLCDEGGGMRGWCEVERGTALNLGTTTSQKCAVVPMRAHI